jgi:hypothetical protein
MSASDRGAVDFEATVLFAFDAGSLLIDGSVAHPAATTRKETSARIFFMSRTPLAGRFNKTYACFYAKTLIPVKAEP